MEPTLGGVTVIVAVDDNARPTTVAVMMSEPAQPISRYDAVATPPIVAAVAVNAARPLAAHGDEKLTLNGVLVGVPPTRIVTLTDVVPNADSIGVPIDNWPIDKFTAPSE